MNIELILEGKATLEELQEIHEMRGYDIILRAGEVVEINHH